MRAHADRAPGSRARNTVSGLGTTTARNLSWLVEQMAQRQAAILGIRQRAKLICALVIMAGFAILSGVGIGVALHDRAETLDSLDHWRERLREQETGSTERVLSIDSPKVRIRRLEEHLDGVHGRLPALGAVFVLMSVLVVLGYRALRRHRSRTTGAASLE